MVTDASASSSREESDLTASVEDVQVGTHENANKHLSPPSQGLRSKAFEVAQATIDAGQVGLKSIFSSSQTRAEEFARCLSGSEQVMEIHKLLTVTVQINTIALFCRTDCPGNFRNSEKALDLRVVG